MDTNKILQEWVASATREIVRTMYRLTLNGDPILSSDLVRHSTVDERLGHIIVRHLVRGGLFDSNPDDANEWLSLTDNGKRWYMEHIGA